MADSHTITEKALIHIWLVLLLLTGITIGVASVDLGFFNIVAALLVATIKASLVVTFFMHLKEESTAIFYMLIGSLAILALFIGMTFFDVAYR